MSWWLLTFCREYPARYLSHLDTVRALQRTFARARVPIARSAASASCKSPSDGAASGSPSTPRATASTAAGSTGAE